MGDYPFRKGDFVCRNDVGDEVEDSKMGRITGFGPDRKWVRVKTLSGRNKTWLSDNLINVDFVCGEGNYE